MKQNLEPNDYELLETQIKPVQEEDIQYEERKVVVLKLHRLEGEVEKLQRNVHQLFHGLIVALVVAGIFAGFFAYYLAAYRGVTSPQQTEELPSQG